MSIDKPTLVLVDDEQRMLTVLNALFRRSYQVFATDDGFKAIEYIQNNQVNVIISDQRMPILPGVKVLTKVKEVSPNTVRLLLTGYADLQATIDSVNEAEVFRYINKPWSNTRLKEIVKEAAEVSQSLFSGDETEISVAAIPQAQSNLVSGSTATVGASSKPIKTPPVVPNSTPEKKIETKSKSIFNILVIDKVVVSKRIQQLVADKYKVYQASSIEDCFNILGHQEISLIISEIREGNEDIQMMLEKLKNEYPEIITIILSGTADSTFVASLINHAQIYRFLPKKHLNPALLMKSINSAITRHIALKNSPSRVQQYKVEENMDIEETSIASKMMSFLKRLRQKNA